MEQGFEQLKSEKENRLYLRKEMAEHNKHLADAARDAGVIKPVEYAIFHNHGYMGLYDGLGAKENSFKKRIEERIEYFRPYGQYRIGR